MCMSMRHKSCVKDQSMFNLKKINLLLPNKHGFALVF